MLLKRETWRQRNRSSPRNEAAATVCCRLPVSSGKQPIDGKYSLRRVDGKIRMENAKKILIVKTVQAQGDKMHGSMQLSVIW